MIKKELQTFSEKDTLELGEKLAMLLYPGDMITLEGELGAGKTTFTKGLAKGLGVKRTVSSPTYTIVKEYEGRVPFYHMDVYRLEHSEEDIGFDEYFYGNGVTVVEWAKYIEDFLPEGRLNIHISYGEGDSRVLQFTANNAHFESIVNELLG